MGARVLVPGALRSEVDGASRLEIDEVGTLRAVLDEVDRRWPRLGRRIRDERGELRRYVNVYVDGQDCRSLDGQETPVPDGAEVQVIPSVAGGSDIDGDAILEENFAPWVREPGLTVEETGADFAGGALVAQASTVYALL